LQSKCCKNSSVDCGIWTAHSASETRFFTSLELRRDHVKSVWERTASITTLDCTRYPTNGIWSIERRKPFLEA
jgi:hypothetical protein